MRKALLDAYVVFKTAKNFVKTVKEQALGREVLTSIQPGQLLIKITHEELTKLMGQAAAPLELKGKPSTILLAGLQGAGKTTHAGKLAARIAKSGRKPLLIACDVHRPAAVDQLHVVGESVGADQVQASVAFDGTGTFGGGGSTTTPGCTDETACNYAADADEDDGSCTYPASANVDCDGNCLVAVDCAGECGGSAVTDEWGVCGGSGIPAGDCDCNGNQLDALGVCGGSCMMDADADGICDDVDDCVGSLDACGICNGPGAIYACGCSDIPAGDCDCDGNQLDALGNCGGGCAADMDADGICDDVDPCVGQLDECGVCNGDGSSCADPCAAAAAASAYSLTVESAPAVGAGGTVYRFYVNAQDDSDKISAVFGNDQAH